MTSEDKHIYDIAFKTGREIGRSEMMAEMLDEMAMKAMRYYDKGVSDTKKNWGLIDAK